MFLWFHVRCINSVKIHPERITRNDRKIAKSILARLKQKIAFALMCFGMKTSWFFQFTFQIKNLKTQWIYYL